MTDDPPRDNLPTPPLPLDWRETLMAIRRRIVLAVATFLTVMVLVTVFTFTQSPVYEAQVALTTPDSQMPAMQLDPLLGAALGLGRQSLDDQTWMLTEPVMLQEVCDDLGLEIRGKDLADRTRADVIGTSLIVMKVRDEDAGRAADIANRIAETHVRRTEERAHESLGETLESLGQQISHVERRVTDSEQTLKDFQSANAIVDVQQQAGQVAELIGDYTARIAEAQALAAAASTRADYYRRELAQTDQSYIASSTLARNPLVGRLESRLSDLESERASQSMTRGPEHPEMQELGDEITSVRDELATTLETIVSAEVETENPAYRQAAQELAQAEAHTVAESAHVAALQSNLDGELGKLRDLPDLSYQLSQLERDATITGTLYVELLQRFEKARLQSEQALESIRVHTSAEPPPYAIEPRKGLNLAIGFVLGIGLGLLMAMAVEVARDPLRSERHIRAELGLPVLGRIPGSPAALEQVMKQVASPGSALDDAYQALRLGVQATISGGESCGVVIATTSESNRGREVAVGLATAAGQSGFDTLLMEGNLRTPACAGALGLETGPGLADCLAGDRSPADCLQRSAVPKLSLLAAGSGTSAAVALFDSPSAREVLRSASEPFDFVVATAPTWPIPDALPLTAALGAVLIVVREGRTSRRAAKELSERLERVGQRPIGVCILQQ